MLFMISWIFPLVLSVPINRSPQSGSQKVGGKSSFGFLQDALQTQPPISSEPPGYDSNIHTESPVDNPSVPFKTSFPGIPNKVAKPPASRKPTKLFPLMHPPIPLPAEECLTDNGEMGECLSPRDCGMTNGYISGLCHKGMDVSAYPRVCCTYKTECGFTTSKSVSYFSNPGYPTPVTNYSDCEVDVMLNPGVCQVRLDFLDFDMTDMHDGECSSNNQLLVGSPNSNAYIPVTTFCGKMSQDTSNPVDYLRTDIPHIYIHFENLRKDSRQVLKPNQSPNLVSLTVKVTNRPSKWNIKVTQIVCDGAPLEAPAGCAQYYNAPSGTMTSLNYFGHGYLRNLDVDACVRLDQRACAIAYSLEKMKIGSGSKLSYGLSCDDYIVFRGEKTGICGSAESREIVLPIRGVQGIFMHTDNAHNSNDMGFKVNYRYIRDCSEHMFFRYPHLKK